MHHPEPDKILESFRTRFPLEAASVRGLQHMNNNSRNQMNSTPIFRSIVQASAPAESFGVIACSEAEPRRLRGEKQ